MHISKEGDPYLRTLLVQGAQHILGPFGHRLRSQALGPEAGRTWREEREEASHRGDREKAGGVAASPVGERRSVRTVAQQQPNDSGGSRVKQSKRQNKVKIVPGREKQKPKAEFR